MKPGKLERRRYTKGKFLLQLLSLKSGLLSHLRLQRTKAHTAGYSWWRQAVFSLTSWIKTINKYRLWKWESHKSPKLRTSWIHWGPFLIYKNVPATGSRFYFLITAQILGGEVATLQTLFILTSQYSNMPWLCRLKSFSSVAEAWVTTSYH